MLKSKADLIIVFIAMLVDFESEKYQKNMIATP